MQCLSEQDLLASFNFFLLLTSFFLGYLACYVHITVWVLAMWKVWTAEYRRDQKQDKHLPSYQWARRKDLQEVKSGFLSSPVFLLILWNNYKNAKGLLNIAVNTQSSWMQEGRKTRYCLLQTTTEVQCRSSLLLNTVSAHGSKKLWHRRSLCRRSCKSSCW